MDDGARRAIIRDAVIESPGLWTHARGSRVRHGTFGMGTIIGVIAQGNDVPDLSIRFDRDPGGKSERRFQLQALFDTRYFPERCGFPEALEQAVAHVLKNIAAEEERMEREAALAEQRRKDREARKEREAALAEQRRKEREARQAAALEEARRRRQAAAEAINAVIDKAHRGVSLNEAEIRILMEQKEHGLLARYYQRRYERTGRVWDLIRASSEWRSDGNPQAALKATDPVRSLVDSMPPKLASALLTTRGAAFRDLRDFEAAEQCAREAIARDGTNARPYSLLGAIHIQRGEAWEGEECFARAEQLGAKMNDLRPLIEQALRSLDAVERTSIVQTLRHLNPQRYGWLAQELRPRSGPGEDRR